VADNTNPPPEPDTRENPLGPVVRALVKAKARRLVGRAGLTRQDRPDVEQELVVRLLEGLGTYDLDRGTWPAFARTVIARAGANVLRHRTAACRDGAREQPLAADVPAPEPERAEERPDPDAVRAAVAQLGGDARLAAEAALDGTGTVVAVARALGVSRYAARALLRGLRTHPAFEALAPPEPPD
jgi:DNA-directed RNA polymerase specialized sigma24 family protein